VNCPECFEEIDVTDLEPGDVVECAECGSELHIEEDTLVRVAPDNEEPETDVEDDETEIVQMDEDQGEEEIEVETEDET
jgi:DNA-directed RNA polymerase subunit M/transcription elongation factor TFIIS